MCVYVYVCIYVCMYVFCAHSFRLRPGWRHDVKRRTTIVLQQLKMRRFFYRNFRVILGGGKKQFGIPVDPGKDDSCNRTDGRNLLDTWMSDKKGSMFVDSTAQLMNADSSKVRNVRHFCTFG